MAATLASQAPERAERIAQGVALVVQGSSYREAAKAAGIDDSTLYRAVRRCEAVIDDPGAVERVAAKAAVLTERSVERMAERLDNVDDRHLAQWTFTAAKLAGMVGAEQGQDAGGLGALLGAVARSGGSIEVGARVTVDPPLAPNQGDNGT